MLTEIMFKKLARHFEFIDFDKDGYVEKTDWEQCAHNLASLRDWEPDSAEYNAIISKHVDIWTNNWLPADTDGDGRVSQAEYLDLADQLQNGTASTEEEKAEATAAGKKSNLDQLYDLFGAVFDVIDRDGDGKIKLHDYKDYFKAWGADENLADEAFSSIDLNSDGSVGRMSFVQYGTNFFISDDENEFGTLLFGPLE